MKMAIGSAVVFFIVAICAIIKVAKKIKRHWFLYTPSYSFLYFLQQWYACIIYPDRKR